MFTCAFENVSQSSLAVCQLPIKHNHPDCINVCWVGLRLPLDSSQTEVQERVREGVGGGGCGLPGQALPPVD